MASNPKVSVCVITYNQEQYISECLDSILGQKVNFDYEIIIGEDCSTDLTGKVVQEYASKHTNIKFLDNSKNRGVLPNFIRTLKEAQGQYIAFCEGDDYWIDQNKLQKQVNFLELNTKFGGVCAEIISENVEVKTKIKNKLKNESEIHFEELIKKNKIHSNTILFRSKLLNTDDLRAIEKLSIGDWYLHLLITKHKPYYYLPEYFALYRIHNSGIFSKKNNFYKAFQKSKLLLSFYKNEATEENSKTIIKSLELQVYRALKASSKEDKLELKELFSIIKDEKIIKINRSLIRGFINML